MLSKLAPAYRAFVDIPDVTPDAGPLPVETQMFRPQSQRFLTDIATTAVTLDDEATDDAVLVQRIIDAYHRAQNLPRDTGSFWSNHFGGLKTPIHEMLMRGESP